MGILALPPDVCSEVKQTMRANNTPVGRHASASPEAGMWTHFRVRGVDLRKLTLGMLMGRACTSRELVLSRVMLHTPQREHRATSKPLSLTSNRTSETTAASRKSGQKRICKKKSICNNPGRTCEQIYRDSIPRLTSISSQHLKAKDIDFREDDVTCLRSMIKHHTMAAVAGAHKEDAIASANHGVLNKMQRILEKCDPAMQVWGRKGQVAQATNILLSHFVFAATSTFGAAGMAVPLALQGADWARFLSSINSMDGVLDANTFSKLPSNKREAALMALNAFLQVADVPGAVDLPDAAEFLKVAVENLKEAYEPGEEAGEEDTPALRPNDDQQATLKGIHQKWVTEDCQKSMDRIADEQKKTLEALVKSLEAAKSADSIVGEQELVEPAIDQNKSI